MRKAFEDQNNSANGMLKAFKIGGWMFIGIGVMLCLTVIGIPVGLLLIGAGFLIMKVLPSIMQKKHDVLAKATAEQAEIHEFNLAKARAAKDQPPQSARSADVKKPPASATRRRLFLP
jgi:hypothetical protein